MVKLDELLARDYAVAVTIDLFEQIHELTQKFLVLAKLEIKNCFQELGEINFVADDLGRLERVGSSSLFGLGVSALLSAVCSILCGKIEAALWCLGWLRGAEEAEV